MGGSFDERTKTRPRSWLQTTQPCVAWQGSATMDWHAAVPRNKSPPLAGITLRTTTRRLPQVHLCCS